MSKCKYCGTDINWGKIGGKPIPMNLDGMTKHQCKDGVQLPGIPISGVLDAASSGANIQQGTKAQYAKPAFDAGEDKNKLILWQSCMKIAVEACAQVGDFATNDEAHARRIAYMTLLLYEESLSVWRTGSLRPEIPNEYKSQINQMSP
jgi:hypothetical protein